MNCVYTNNTVVFIHLYLKIKRDEGESAALI